MATFGIKTCLVALIGFMVAVTMMSSRVEGLTCGQVVSGVSPCINYLRGKAPLPAACCAGIKNLNSQAKTTADRQTACNCLKSTASGVSGINYGLAGGLPGRCGVSIPYKISPSTDCSRIK